MKMNICKSIRKAMTAVVVKIHTKTEELLTTTKAGRKANRKLAKATRRLKKQERKEDRRLMKQGDRMAKARKRFEAAKKGYEAIVLEETEANLQTKRDGDRESLSQKMSRATMFDTDPLPE